jgi:hypothetical protein
MAIHLKITSCFGHSSREYTEYHIPCKSPWNPKTMGILLTKMALKRKIDEFLVMPLKPVLSVMDLVNYSGTPTLWTIAHENGPKIQKL